MHGSFDRSGKSIRKISAGWGIGIFLLPVFVVIALVGMAMSHQGASKWVAEAAQGEFAATHPAPQVAPTQLAQPKQIRTVKVD